VLQCCVVLQWCTKGRAGLYWAFMLLGLALSSECLCVFGLYGAVIIIIHSFITYIHYIYRLKNFCLHPSLYLSVSWAWWNWPLMWLTSHRPSVGWHCWLGHLTCKTVSEMTVICRVACYLNPTILYYWPELFQCSRKTCSSPWTWKTWR